MLFSAKTEYACLAMLELAARRGDPKPARLTDIADKHGIPPRFLVQILIQLKGAGLVASTRGASGGYQLSRAPSEITLADIFEVVDRTDDSVSKGNRPTNKKGDVTPMAFALHEVWDNIVQAREKILRQTTLENLVSSGQGLQYVI